MQLWAWTPASGQRRSWRLSEPLCCLAFTASRDRLLLALASGLAFLDLNTGLPAPICALDASTMPSDARCDRQGRFVFGTGAADSDARGGFWRLNHDLSLERLPLGDAVLPSSIGFNPNGRTMYFADAAEGTIRCCDYHPCSGEITRPRVFLDDAAGASGGVAVDADGRLWSVRRGAGQLLCIAPDAAIARVLPIDTPHPGWPVFGGADFGTLYLPAAGADNVGAHRTGAQGLAEERFLGQLPSRV